MHRTVLLSTLLVIALAAQSKEPPRGPCEKNFTHFHYANTIMYRLFKDDDWSEYNSDTQAYLKMAKDLYNDKVDHLALINSEFLSTQIEPSIENYLNIYSSRIRQVNEEAIEDKLLTTVNGEDTVQGWALLIAAKRAKDPQVFYKLRIEKLPRLVLLQYVYADEEFELSEENRTFTHLRLNLNEKDKTIKHRLIFIVGRSAGGVHFALNEKSDGGWEFVPPFSHQYTTPNMLVERMTCLNGTMTFRPLFLIYQRQ